MDWLDPLLSSTKARTDLEYFAAQFLKIRPKSGSQSPLIFNAAQKRLHALLEEQKARHGRVRAIVLKGRQMGISTYIAARFFHKTIHHPGVRTLIVAHERPASNNLFKLVKRFQENLPDEMRQSVGTSNQQELIFDKIDSGYGVSVATEDGAGRSDTAQLLHASEVAFWKDLGAQIAGLLQTVPDTGSEIILETTANGFNEFHKYWRKAQAGENAFEPIFLPWSLEPGYSMAPPDDFRMTDEESQIAELHGLDLGRIAWRRMKVADFNGEDKLFRQEFPLDPDEAFTAEDSDSFIPADLVMKARKEKIEPYGPLIVGVDPAGKSYAADGKRNDRTSIAYRRGHCIEKIESRRGLTTMEVAGLIGQIIQEQKPAAVNIDTGGLGIGIYERLIEQGHADVVRNVNFASKPLRPPPLDESGEQKKGGPLNRRAELWANMRKALEGRFSIPDSLTLHADLTAPSYKFDSAGRLVIEAKEDMRKRGLPSPDEADAMALCFAEPDGSGFPKRKRFWDRDVNAEVRDHAYW